VGSEATDISQLLAGTEDWSSSPEHSHYNDRVILDPLLLLTHVYRRFKQKLLMLTRSTIVTAMINYV
jgi:hypothetical protein